MAKQKEESKNKFQTTMDNLEKMYGKGTVIALDSKVSGEYDVISSGSLGFDYVTLGVGGFVKGKLYEIMGWDGSGKTTLCAHAVAECQKAGGTALYIDGEHAVDKNYFQSIGVDTSKLLFTQPNCGEEGFKIAEDMIKTGEISLCIIDSDSSLIPKSAIVDGDIGDSAIGKKAKLNSSSYPRLKNALVMNKTCVIVISQYREKIGVMFGNPTTTQGGHALKFYADCRIQITNMAAKAGDVVYGNTTKVKAIKNKMCPPYRVTQFDIIYGKGIDKIGEFVELAVLHKIILKSGSWFSYGDTKLGQGVESVKTIMSDNPELFEEIKAKVISVVINEDVSSEFLEENETV